MPVVCGVVGAGSILIFRTSSPPVPGMDFEDNGRRLETEQQQYGAGHTQDRKKCDPKTTAPQHSGKKTGPGKPTVAFQPELGECPRDVYVERVGRCVLAGIVAPAAVVAEVGQVDQVLTRKRPYFEFANLRFVHDIDAQPFGRGVVGVHQGFAATEKVGIGSGQMKRSPQRRLKPATVRFHPFPKIGRLPDSGSGQLLVRAAAGDPQQVIPEFVLEIGSGQVVAGAFMQVSQVAGLAAVAAPEMPGSALEQQDPHPGLPRRHGRAERSVAAANDKDVKGLLQINV